MWFTGLSASGKTSIANALETLLTKNNNHSYILDGDVFRKGLSSDLSFDKKKVERRISDVSVMLLKCFVMPEYYSGYVYLSFSV